MKQARSHVEIVALLEEMQRLMELRGENVFKIRAFEKAAQLVSERGENEDWLTRAKEKTLTELPGIGKGIAETLTEFLLEGKTTARDEMKAQISPALLELTQVRGLGPKKAQLLIDELGIQSVAELEYACRENRLLSLKGFGEKVQAKVLESIEFLKTTQGWVRLDEAFTWAEGFLPELAKTIHELRHPWAAKLKIVEAGMLRRRCEVMDRLDFLIESPAGEKARADLEVRAQLALERYRKNHPLALPVNLHYATADRFGSEWARLSSSEGHWKAIEAPADVRCAEETAFYQEVKLPWIPPEMRETGEEVKLARAGKLDQVLPWDGLLGVFHNHTTRSDGTATAEQMIQGAIERGYQYIGLSDHSQSAFYAQGLKSDALKEQEREIRELQEKYPQIRIFWGIESDILADGSLDYTAAELKRFDFVIASIHSRFQMDRQAMTDRIVMALRHPATRFLGHPTGRLLLGRKGYDVDFEKIILEAARHDVAIEINAHPARLDVDWRWGAQLRAHGAWVSVNPDAHEVAGLDDTKYGIAVARKALLPTNQVVNAKSAKDVAQWLARS